MSWRSGRGALAIVALGLVSTVVVIRRVRGEYERSGSLRASTAVTVWTLYGAHGGAVVWLARAGAWPLPFPERLARPVGGTLVASGAALLAAGAAPFRSLGELSATRHEGLITDGAYRYSRNPQNVALLVVLFGVAARGRSGLGALLAAGLGVAFRFYVGAEERHLGSVYGEEYERYRRRTPRFLGRPR